MDVTAIALWLIWQIGKRLGAREQGRELVQNILLRTSAPTPQCPMPLWVEFLFTF